MIKTIIKIAVIAIIISLVVKSPYFGKITEVTKSIFRSIKI